jgi:arylsulfatase A-like enzyme
VPLIIYDPSSEADATRGTVSDALVEAIDLAPTFVEIAGGEPEYHVLEGESLLPLLRGERSETQRDYAICEYDYSATPTADALNHDVRKAVMFMVTTRDWKLIHCEGEPRPILFDLANDPLELRDLGDSQDHQHIIEQMYDRLFAWTRRPSQRTTRSRAQLEEMRAKTRRRGVIIGIYDENEAPLELTVKYRNRTAPNMKQGTAAE